MQSEINKHLVREPTVFGLLDRLNESELWDFSEADQSKILEAAVLLFKPFETMYLDDPSHLQVDPEMQSACKLIRTAGWPGVWQAMWKEKRLDGEFCAYALSLKD
jgi:hypothetical protein